MSSRDREVQEFRKLEREKSFDEARSAVQSQIEKMFQLKARATTSSVNGPQNIRSMQQFHVKSGVAR